MKSLILLSFVLFSMSISAQNNFIPIQNQEKFKNEFANYGNNLLSLSSNFIQEKHLEYLSSSIISEGKLWYKKDSMVRWEYIKPFKYLIVKNKNKITITDENRKQEYNRKPNKAFQFLNDILSGSVNGSLLTDERFTFNVSENNIQYMVELTPRVEEDKKIFKNIQLYFAKADKAIYMIKMIEPNNDYISLKFENRKVNINIDNKLFTDF
jgi:outer membrane lipoprotein carrier protein